MLDQLTSIVTTCDWFSIQDQRGTAESVLDNVTDIKTSKQCYDIYLPALYGTLTIVLR